MISIKHIFDWVTLTSLQVSLLIGLILLIQICLRGRLAGRWHYGLWLLVIIRLMMPWAPQSRLSLYNLTPVSSLPQFNMQESVTNDYLALNSFSPKQDIIETAIVIDPVVDKSPVMPSEQSRHFARVRSAARS